MMGPIHSDSTRRALVDCDLSEATIEDAIELFLKADQPGVLVAPLSSAYTAGRLCQKYNLQFIGVPDEIMKEDSWLLTASYSSVWSPGA